MNKCFLLYSKANLQIDFLLVLIIILEMEMWVRNMHNL